MGERFEGFSPFTQNLFAGNALERRFGDFYRQYQAIESTEALPHKPRGYRRVERHPWTCSTDPANPSPPTPVAATHRQAPKHLKSKRQFLGYAGRYARRPPIAQRSD